MAVLSAAFCIICSLAMDEGDELGNQMGAAYVNRDLKVIVRVSFCWPQDVPAKDFKMFSLERARSQTAPM